MVKAAILSIGDELLNGHTTDTNSSFMAGKMHEAGIMTDIIVSTGDDVPRIISTLDSLTDDHEIVVTTGGMGPTSDDKTKEALRILSNSKSYRLHEEQLSIIKSFIRKELVNLNIPQAEIPDGLSAMANKYGTAPVLIYKNESKPLKPVIYSLPGVPREVHSLMPEIITEITGQRKKTDTVHRTLMLSGIIESELASKLEDFERSLPESMRLSYLPDIIKGISLNLSVRDSTDSDILKFKFEKLKNIVKDYVYAEEESSLQQEIGNILKEKGLTLSAAESCTGGRISHLITSVPGSSLYYCGGITAYSIPLKERILNVPSEIIQKYGVVSKEVASYMAEGVRKLTGSDFAISTTGFSGTEGDDKYPGGTVWIGFSSENKTSAVMFMSSYDRKTNTERFASRALHFLWKNIKE